MLHPWEQLAEENPKAFVAFKNYLAMDSEKRTKIGAYLATYGEKKKCKTAPQFIVDWSIKFKWKERVLEYDRFHQQEFVIEDLKQTRKNARKWAKRRDQVREDEWEIRDKMLIKIREILEKGTDDFKLSQFPNFVKAFMEMSRLSVDMPTSKKEISIKDVRDDVKKMATQIGVEVDPDEAIAIAIQMLESEAVH